MDHAGHILIVGEDPTAAGTLMQHLTRDGYAVDVIDDGAAMQRQLRKTAYSVVLVNLDHPGCREASVIQTITLRSPQTQIVALVDCGATHLALEALRLGAYDYITKPYGDPSLATLIVQRAMEKSRLIHENRRLDDTLRHTTDGMQRVVNKLGRLATRDDVTNLYNQRQFQEFLSVEISRAQRYGRIFTMLIVTIDSFLLYKQTHGDKAAELLLHSFSVILRDFMRTSDTAARLDEFEFALLLPETAAAGATHLIERLRTKVFGYPFPGIETLPGRQLAFSTGTATFPEHGKDSATLLEHAMDGMQSPASPAAEPTS